MTKQGVAPLRWLSEEMNFPGHFSLLVILFLRILPGFVSSTDSSPVPQPFLAGSFETNLSGLSGHNTKCLCKGSKIGSAFLLCLTLVMSSPTLLQHHQVTIHCSLCFFSFFHSFFSTRHASACVRLYLGIVELWAWHQTRGTYQRWQWYHADI